MNIELTPKSSSELIPTDILFQTVFWGQVKKSLGWKPLAFNLDFQSHSGDVLVLTKHVADGIPIAYVPQGPENSPEPENYGIFLEELSDALTEYLDPATSFIRYDLPWLDQYSEFPSVDQLGNNHLERPEPRLRELRMNFGTRMWNLKKAAFDFTVADTIIINLIDNNEIILSRMKSKTRYNIRLSERKGVRVFNASVEMLPAFYDLYLQTAGRNRFTVCDYEKFSALFAALDGSPGSPEVHFLLAEHGDDILAGAILAISGTTAVYLFGASSNYARNLMASYAVQWHAILLAKARGCLIYDMGAVSPANDPTHPFYGMYRFKTGFGGRIIHRAGSWDYPINYNEYERFRNYEIFEQVIG